MYDLYPDSWKPELNEVQPPKPLPEQVAHNRAVQVAVESTVEV